MRRASLGKTEWIDKKWKGGVLTHPTQQDSSSCGVIVIMEQSGNSFSAAIQDQMGEPEIKGGKPPQLNLFFSGSKYCMRRMYFHASHPFVMTLLQRLSSTCNKSPTLIPVCLDISLPSKSDPWLRPPLT
ncbi:unnamed protein product [Pleuronectes platessa]|uniref:Uncharacterized protein n=1 Tax=Pleuronectes platessa TaxID=8262 RepID=A0A9N7Y0J7_PLEPL|nr:unnamed protein product [Pleuronectes platessa]